MQKILVTSAEIDEYNYDDANKEVVVAAADDDSASDCASGDDGKETDEESTDRQSTGKQSKKCCYLINSFSGSSVSGLSG